MGTPRFRATKWLLLVGACGGLLLPAIARAEFGFDAAAGFAYDDNLSNALEAEDRKAGGAITADLAGVLHEQLGPSTGLGMSLVGESVSNLRYSGLSNLGLGARAQLRQKFGLGGDAPWAAVSAQAIHRDFRYDYRTGWQYDAGATAGKQLSERWAVSGSVRYDRYTADHLQPAVLPGISTAAYDTSGWSFGARATFVLTETDLLSASYTWRKGTVTAVTPPDHEILEYASAVARDTVFSDMPPLIAYRIQAKSDILGLAWSHSLSRYTAVNVAYVFQRSRAGSDLGDYYSNLISISVSYSQ